MAIKEIKREWNPCQLAYVKTFLLHTEEDLKHMPRCSVGSRATVSETDNEYVKTSDGWMLLCDCDEDGGQGAGGGGVQPDWNQNDQNAADYVKNRPYYREVKRKHFNEAFGINVFPCTVVTKDEGWAAVGSISGPVPMVEGLIYEVIFNGKSYNCEPKSIPMRDYTSVGLITVKQKKSILRNILSPF